MKKIIIWFTVLTTLFCLNFSASAKILDPAREKMEKIQEYGYDLDTMPTMEEVLENGDIFIWHIDNSKSVESYVKAAQGNEELVQAIEYAKKLYGDNKWAYNKYENHPEIDGIKLEIGVFTKSTYRRGDVNVDTIVDMKDVLELRWILILKNKKINLITSDINGDKVVNMKDVLGLRHLLIEKKL